MGIDSFIVYIKIKDIYVDIAKDVDPRFDAWYYELDIPLPKGKNKTVIGLMKGELDRKIMKVFTAQRAKIYGCLTDNNNEDKKAKGTKKCNKTWKLNKPIRKK